MEKIEQVNEDFNVKKTKKKGLLIGGIIAIAVAIVIILIYFLMISKPEFIFSKTIDKVFEVDSDIYESIKIDTEIKASIEAEDTTYQEELEEIEKFTIKAGTQMDIAEKKEIVNLGLEYDNEAVADAQVYYDNGDMYAYFEGLFDKYIEVDMDEEAKEQFEDIFDNTDADKTKEFLDAYKDELKAEIKERGKFEKKKTTIKIGNEERKVTKNTYELTDKEAYKMIENIMRNLGKNEKLLDTVEKSKRTEFKEAMNEIADSVEEVATDDDITFKISLYTKGFLNNKLVAVDVEIYSEYDESTLVVKIVKEDEGIYTYNVFEKADKQKNEFLKGKVEIEKDKDSKKEQSGKATITVEVIELGSVKLEIDYSVEYNSGVDKINTKNSVNINDLTDADMESIMENLMERPLIGELISSQMNLLNTEIEDNIIDGADVTTQNTLTTLQNEVKDEYYGYSVIYSIPTQFVYDADITHDYRKYYDFEDGDSEIRASVSLGWYTENEYAEEEINWDYEYYSKETEYYKNVKLSETKTLTVGDKTFKYVILSYEAADYEEMYQNVYVWYPLGDEHVFIVELDSIGNEVTEDIIKGFLNISVKEI